MNVISLINVSKTIKNNRILRNVNVCFSSPGIYGIIGRNGAGKSVMLKVLMRLYTHSEGKVLFNNEVVDKFEDFPFVIRGFLEVPRFLPNLSGQNNLSLLSSDTTIESISKVHNVLKIVGLFEEKDKKYKGYSFGMRQKLGIACSILDEPDVLILDEPFNGIDYESATRIRKFLKDFSVKDKIVIISTHIKDDLYNLCDKVFEMNEGVLTGIDKKDLQ